MSNPWHNVSYEITGESRMNIAPHGLTIEQFCALPDETELVLIDIAPFGLATRAQGITLNSKAREEMTEIVERFSSDDRKLPYSMIIYVLPEDWVPDVADLMFGKFSSLGERHGREGAPMLSAAMLRARNEEEWTDEAYTTYVTAYKTAAAKRKGN